MREGHLHENRGTRNYTTRKARLELFGEERRVLFSQAELYHIKAVEIENLWTKCTSLSTKPLTSPGLM